MARKATNKLLKAAKKSKNDEFYTQLSDIERELQHYQGHFKGKIVYCNCDDSRISNFYRYFRLNFRQLGLKKVIASCYKETPCDLFDMGKHERAFCTEYDGAAEKTTYFNGNGDFRGQESLALLEQSDVVVTNPPFSLFRPFVSLLMQYRKKFLIIGNINAITYKDIFKLIQEDKVWLGVNLGRGISGFIVPESYELYGTEARIDSEGNRIVSPNNCLWLTNLDIARRHEYIPLTQIYEGNEDRYPKYDNYDGINVGRTQDIPRDYFGAMGVPITFLHKFNPEQFNIIKFRKGDDGKDLTVAGQSPFFRILIKPCNDHASCPSP